MRNLLEKNSFRPLMFFLKCLNDDDEIDDLIKREIDCRGRFILCDSENARNSDWVKKEVEYIKSKQRIYQTINVDDTEENIANEILGFRKSSSVYISYSREDAYISKQLSDLLEKDWDFMIAKFDLFVSYSQEDESIYRNLADAMGDDWNMNLMDLEYLKKKINKALEEGYVIFMITKNFLKSRWCIEELLYAFERIDKHRKNVIILTYDIPDTQIRNIIPNYNWHHSVSFTVTNGELIIDRLDLYFKFMGDKILERAQNGDPIAEGWKSEYAERLYRIGERLFFRGRYTDKQCVDYDKAAYGHLKRAADLGHKDARELLDMDVWHVDKEELLNDYEMNQDSI